MGYVDKLGIILSSKKLKGFNYQDEEKDEFGIDYIVNCKINVLFFYRIIEFLDKVGVEKVKLITEKNNLILKTYNFLISEIKIQLIYSVEENIISMYGVKYLKTILKNYKLKELKNEEFIFLEFGNKTPIKIKFKEDWIILAPRVEGD